MSVLFSQRKCNRCGVRISFGGRGNLLLFNKTSCTVKHSLYLLQMGICFVRPLGPKRAFNIKALN